MREKIYAWITKDALTVGIYANYFYIDDKNPNIISYEIGDIVYRYITEGTDWHRTFEEAAKRADFMRLKRIQELKKELARLEALDFSA
jgi:hypothetical protein